MTTEPTEDPQALPAQADSCIIWPKGKKRENGYGILYVKIQGKHRQFLAHRWTWMQSRGPIPEGLCVLHRCDTPACVNINHLFLGTQADNMRDMTAKGRRRWGHSNKVRGETHPGAIFKEEQVKTVIREWLGGSTIRSIQSKFGFKCSYHTIYAIVHRITWKHVTT